jgi:branched-chain amino acid transport system permease protein
MPFLMLTLAIGQLAATLAVTWDSVTQGTNGLFGIPPVQLVPGGEPLTGPAGRYWYTLGGFAVGLAVLWAVTASPFGRALRGIRDNDARMSAIGYPTAWFKYVAFCVAGTVAGAAGALLTAHDSLVSPSHAAFETSVIVLLAVIIGGVGSLWGPCLGAAVVLLLRDTVGIRLGGHGPLLLGAAFIAVVYLLPGGIAGLRLPTRRHA